MVQPDIIPHLFRTEYRKIVAVLCHAFGVEHIEVAEDIVSDSFLLASEVLGLKGLPDNPTAWLYTVAKNKTRDYLKRHLLFAKTISHQIKYSSPPAAEVEIDLWVKSINDSQLAMIFVVCHPCNPPEAQITLALSLLCGFGAEEIASAFLTNKEVIYKRLQRAKQKLRSEKIKIEQPSTAEITSRLPVVLMTLYLLFNEGYFSSVENRILRDDLCREAIRLASLLAENAETSKPPVKALLSLMYFHSSRFNARLAQNGQIILYENQDRALWDRKMILKGEALLKEASQGDTLSKYHVEAAIAYWHTSMVNEAEKWDSILQLYNHLLVIEYSPVAALNRTYALAKVAGKETAIKEAEKVNLDGNYFYHVLLGDLYCGFDEGKASLHLEKALGLTKSKPERVLISQKLRGAN